jgi:ribosomal protein S12 methylthiotransferase accessory factor
LASVDDPVAVELVDRFEAAEMDVMAWDVTSDVAVATFQVVIVDRTADPVLRPLPAAYGAGTHPDRGVALVRALTEAAQSRLTAIAGARDDLTRAGYRTTQRAEALAAHAQEARRTGRRAFAAAPTVANPTVDADVGHVVAALRSRGALPIVVVDLSRDDVPVHAVRVVVGRLEAPMESPSFRAGGRARAHLAQLARRSEGAA